MENVSAMTIIRCACGCFFCEWCPEQAGDRMESECSDAWPHRDHVHGPWPVLRSLVAAVLSIFCCDEMPHVVWLSCFAPRLHMLP